MSRTKFDGRSVEPFSAAAAVSLSRVDVDIIAVPQFRAAKECDKARFAEKFILRGETNLRSSQHWFHFGLGFYLSASLPLTARIAVLIVRVYPLRS
jgi:hypothetical protein